MLLRDTAMLLSVLLGLAACLAPASATVGMDVSGCYRQDGSGNGFDKPVGGHQGHVYLQQRQRDDVVQGCIQQYCFSALDGDLTVTENGVGLLRLTRSGGNCTAGRANQTKVPGLALFLFVFPAGWDGEPTVGSFVNNWETPQLATAGHAGWLTLNKTADDECRFMAHQGCMGPPPNEAVNREDEQLA